MDLLHEVQDYIEQHRLVQTDERLVVGVSGGPDSVTLLHVLCQLRAVWNLDIHVAHLHHGLRGADADADADFVTALAASWDVPCTVERADLPAIAARDHVAVEETARRVRYAFLCRVAQACGARKIVVGHNANDQAETVLMHLLRGAGPAGLRGMLPATPLRDYHMLPLEPPPTDLVLIRPLLAIPRTDIERYCEGHALPTRFDRSNLDTTLFRNQLRHEVLPYLADINPNIHTRLCNLAEVVRADYELLREFVQVAWDTLLVRAYHDALIFDLRGWRAQPLALQRAMVRRAAYQLRRTLRDVDFGHVDNAVKIAQGGHTGVQATLPRGLRLTVGYTTLSIADQDALHLPPEKPWLAPGDIIPLDIPGTLDLPGDWCLHTQWAKHWNLDVIAENANPLVAWMDAAMLTGTPVLRTRRRGDRFQPQGLDGAEVRLSDFLINAKIPRAWRDHLPLLEADGRIVWVVGVRLSQAACLHKASKNAIYVRLQGPKT